jgi:hypothetical protein
MLKFNLLPEWAYSQFKIQRPASCEIAAVAQIAEKGQDLTQTDWSTILTCQNSYVINAALDISKPPLDVHNMPLIYLASLVSEKVETYLGTVKRDYNMILRTSLDLNDPFVWVYFYTYRGDRIINGKEELSYAINSGLTGRDATNPAGLGQRIYDTLTKWPIFTEIGRKALISLAKPVEQEITLYRGQKMSVDIGNAKTTQFMSCTLEKAVAENFNTGYLITFRIPAGTKVIQVDDHPDVICRNYYHTSNEKEYILPPDTVYEIIEINEKINIHEESKE